MVNRFKDLMAHFHKNESGAMSVEKIMILVAISLPILLLIYLYRDKFIDLFKTKSDTLLN